jgi:hypothetical protein
MKKNILVLLVVIIYTASLFAQIGTNIPSTRLPAYEQSWLDSTEMVLPWQNAGCLDSLRTFGGLEMEVFINVTTDLDDVEGDNLTQKLNRIVRDELEEDYLGKSLLFYFPPGEYEFDETIEINRDNVVFKGEGAEVTTLHFVMDYDYYHYLFTVPEPYSVNKWRYLNCFTVSSNHSYIGFEDFKLTRTDNQIYHEETNPASMVNYAGNNFLISGSSYIWISGIHSYHAPRHHISISSGSDHIEVRGCYINKSIHRSGGGNGYGVTINNGSNKCLVENNIFRLLRHAMIVSSDAQHNVFGYNYSREADSEGTTNLPASDMCFHGHSTPGTSGPSENLFEGNIGKFVYFDDAHGGNGPRNLIFRNKATHPGINIQSSSNGEVIVNNAFYETSFKWSVYGFPWMLHSDNNYGVNNHCKNYWYDSDGYWNEYHASEFWQDYSYYLLQEPDFMSQIYYYSYDWPFDPRNDNNPAKDRYVDGFCSTILAEWDHLHITDPGHNDCEAYFYSYFDPVSDDTNKELAVFYFSYNNKDNQIAITIEQNGSIIGDWNNKTVNLSGTNKYIPALKYAGRIVLDDDDTSPISITIDDVTEEDMNMNVSYNASNDPPFPILISIGDDCIYPIRNGHYTTFLYYGYQYYFKFNAPYSNPFLINYGDNYTIRLTDSSGSTHDLVQEGYATFNFGVAYVTIPSYDTVFGNDYGEWGYEGEVYIEIITDVYFCLTNTNDSFFEGMMTSAYGMLHLLFPTTELGDGCPTLYVDGKIKNNIIPLSENQEADSWDYILLNHDFEENSLVELKIYEDQDNMNYIDNVHLISVGHLPGSEIGITNKGDIFNFHSKQRLSVDTSRDSSFVLYSGDSLYISLDEYEFTSDEVYLELTSLIFDGRDSYDGKSHTKIGHDDIRDSLSIFDVVGNYEYLNTTYSEIPLEVLYSESGNVVIKPYTDIMIYDIAFIENSLRDDNEIEINVCNVVEATSILGNHDISSELIHDDDNHFVFSQGEGINMIFEIQNSMFKENEYIFIAKGRYIDSDLIVEEIPNITLNNYPNPFNPNTAISFSITKESKVNLSIYNIKGQKVKTLADSKFEKGIHELIWDSKDSNGKLVSSGIYFYKLKVDGKSESVNKMLLLK